MANSPTQKNYAVSADGTTVRDIRTGLVWERSGSSTKMTYAEAVVYAEKSRTGDQSDWRLPTAAELEGLVTGWFIKHRQSDDRYAWFAAGMVFNFLLLLFLGLLSKLGISRIDTTVFPTTSPNASPMGNAAYWSATKLRKNPQSVWVIDFGLGLDRKADLSESFYVRLVRGTETPKPTQTSLWGCFGGIFLLLSINIIALLLDIFVLISILAIPVWLYKLVM